MTNFKKHLIKGVVTSSFVLGFGFSSTSGVFSTNEVQAAPANVHTIKKSNGLELLAPGYSQVVDLGNGLSLNVVMNDEESFSWELFENEIPETILASGTGQLNVDIEITYVDPISGESVTIIERLVEDKIEEPTQDLSDFTLMYNGKATSENNFAVSYVGEAFDPLKGISFVDASGKAFTGTITADTSEVDTKKIGIYPIEYTITEDISPEQKKSVEPRVVVIQSAVAIANRSLVETVVEEATLTIDKTTNTEGNKASHTSKDGLLKFDIWYISGTNYGLAVTDLTTGELVQEDTFSSTVYSSLRFTVKADFLNASDIYLINFNFTEGGTGSEVLSQTVSTDDSASKQAPAKKETAAKPTKLAQTNAGLGFMPAFSSFGLLGGSLVAFVKSRKK